MKVQCEFYTPTEEEPKVSYIMDWNIREDIRKFAQDANEWLRKGKGYTVQTVSL